MKRNNSPVLLVGFAIGLLILHVAAIFFCDHQYRAMTVAVQQASARQAEAMEAARKAEEAGEDRIPSRNELQGTAEGPVYWAEFYRESTRSLKYLLVVSGLMLLFSLWFARSGRTT